jgi:uncharacterized SAM-binding protein YcdF (DUF218 family)
MFVLLKVLLFFFRPLIWVIILFLATAFTKKEARKRRWFLIALVALVVFSNPFLINQLIKVYEPVPIALAPNTKYTAGIVLGGFVSYNVKENKGYFNPASDRFIQTALLYKRGVIQKVIVTAGNGYVVKHNFREADFIKQHLVELGIPATVIYTDGESKNTLQNAVNSKKIIDSLHIPGPYLLISSAMHLPRSQKVFTKQGMQVVLYPCDFISKSGGNNFIEDVLLPSATALRNWDNFIKELLGTTIYKLTGKG